MNRKELCDAIAAHTRTEARNVDTFLKGFADVVIAAVSKGEAVMVSGFAKFDRVQTNARNGRNPATGQAMRIPATKKAHITPLKGFQDVVCGNIPAPKVSKASSSGTGNSFKSGTSSSSRTGNSFKSGTSSSSRTGNSFKSGTSSSSKAGMSKAGMSKASNRPMVKTMAMKKKVQSKSKSLAKR